MDKRKLLIDNNLKSNFQDFNYDFKDNKLKINDVKNTAESFKRGSAKQPFETNDKSFEFINKTNSSLTTHTENDISYFRNKIEDLQFKADSLDVKLKARDKEIQHQQSQIKKYIHEIHQIQIMEQDYKEQVVSINNELSQWKDKYFANLKEYQYKLAFLTRKAEQDLNLQKKNYEEILNQKQKEIEQIELRFENERDHLYQAIELQNKPQNINNEINELITKYDELETENMGLREKILVFEANQDELKFHIQQISGRLLEQVNKNVQLDQQKQQEIQNCQNQLLAKDKQINNLLIQIEESKNDEQYLDQEKLMQLENLNNQLIEQNSQLEDENQKLKTQISEQQEHENNLKLIIQQQKQQNLKLQQENNQFQEQINQFEYLQVKDSNQKQKEQQEQIDSLLLKLNKVELECEELRQQIGKQNDELIESYRKDIREKDEVIQVQGLNQKEFEKVMAQYRVENKEYKTKNELLINQNEIQNLQIEEMFKDKQILQKQLETLENNYTIQLQQLQNYQIALNNCKIKEQSYNEQIVYFTQLEDDNSMLQLQNSQLKQQLADLMEEFNPKINLFQQEIIQKKELNELFQLQLHEKDIQLKQLEKDLFLMQEQNQQLFDNNQILQQDISKQQQDLSILKTKPDDLTVNSIEDGKEVLIEENQVDQPKNEEPLENLEEIEKELQFQKQQNADLNFKLNNALQEIQILQEQIVQSQEEFETQITQIKQELISKRLQNDKLELIQMDYEKVKNEIALLQNLNEIKDQQIENLRANILEDETQQDFINQQESQIKELQYIKQNLETELDRNKNEYEQEINKLREERDCLKSKTIEAIQQKVVLENQLQNLQEELLRKQIIINRIDPNQIVEPYKNEYSSNSELNKTPDGKQQQTDDDLERDFTNNQQEYEVQVEDKELIKERKNSNILPQNDQEFEIFEQIQIPQVQSDQREQNTNSFKISLQNMEQLPNQENLQNQQFEEQTRNKEDQIKQSSKQFEKQCGKQEEVHKKIDLKTQDFFGKELSQEEPANTSQTSQELANYLINNALNGAIQSLLNISQ
ncbi:unnamed protein product [Paramecium sonneborni]|uniref:Uncharacterized protein n=1 Tax=Paramecium sonneborni TaxID=65129 RepID=A0A8S1NBV8_9CILI|nr:unnamed protein product [Paramecium sonneborni]